MAEEQNQEAMPVETVNNTEADSLKKEIESLKKKNVVTDFFAEILHGVGSTHMANHEIDLLEEKLEKLQNRLKVAGFEEMDKQVQSTAKELREQNKGLAKNLEINAEVSELQKLEKEHELAIAEIIEKHVKKPEAVGLKLPKLKKVGADKAPANAIKLPKLKKVEA